MRFQCSSIQFTVVQAAFVSHSSQKPESQTQHHNYKIKYGNGHLNDKKCLSVSFNYYPQGVQSMIQDRQGYLHHIKHLIPLQLPKKQHRKDIGANGVYLLMGSTSSPVLIYSYMHLLSSGPTEVSHFFSSIL